MSDNGEHGVAGVALGGRDAELEDMAQDPQRLGQSDSRRYSAFGAALDKNDEAELTSIASVRSIQATA